MRRFLDPGRSGALRDTGLLVLRVSFAASLAAAHGWGKLVHYAERAGRFPDPLGIGSGVSLGLATFAEFFCALALAVGLMGRLAAVPLVVLFAVAFFMIHGDDPFGDKELAFLYLGAFVGLALTGPGRFSIDGLIRKR